MRADTKHDNHSHRSAPLLDQTPFDLQLSCAMLRLQARCATAIAKRAVATAPRCTNMRHRFSSSSSASAAQAASAVPAASATSAVAAAPGAAPARSKKERIAAKASAAAAASTYHPIKGTHDALPLLAARQRSCESLLASLAQSYMYSEIRTPILERTDLFARTLGEASDVVSKEMFAFEDHGTNTVLRPENTASQWAKQSRSEQERSARKQRSSTH